VKIPFGKSLKTGELVEVSNVLGGRACACVCYDCGQGLIARQGACKEWHFAHDPDTEHKPHKACEISFYSACRQYLIHRLISGENFKLLTPPYSIFEKATSRFKGISNSALVTQSKHLSPNNYASDQRFDLGLSIDGSILNLHFLYPDRVEPKYEPGSAVLALDLGFVLDKYEEQTSLKPEPIIDIARNWFENETEGKRWISHPREALVRERLKEQIKTKSEALPQTDSFYDTPEYLWGDFTCLKCGNYWRGHRDRDSKCPNCNTHLYSRFEQSQ